jgi:hypothetical protein
VGAGAVGRGRCGRQDHDGAPRSRRWALVSLGPRSGAA